MELLSPTTKQSQFSSLNALSSLKLLFKKMVSVDVWSMLSQP
jgi:hypothetical protein